jgi:CBS domain-containing protein
MLRVSDIMTRTPATVGSDASVADALRVAAGGDFCHVPVVDSADDAGRLVGIVCLCDLEDAGLSAPISDYMTSPVLTIEPGATVDEAAARMLDCAVGSLPVVVEDDLLGIVTREDLRRIGRTLPGAMTCASCGRHHHVLTEEEPRFCPACREVARREAGDLGTVD